MGHRTDWLALAGTSRVKSYFRKSASGKTVQVDAYTRSVDKMSFDQLQAEFKRLQGSTKPSDVNRRAAVVSRIREESDSQGNFSPDKAHKARLQHIKDSAAANNARIDREREAASQRSALFENMQDMPTGRARLKQARAFRKEIQQKAAAAEPGLRAMEARVNDRASKREAAGPAAAAAIRKAKTIDGLKDLNDSELQSIIDATNWGEPGDKWGEKAQDILSARGRSISDIDPEATGWSPTSEQRRAMRGDRVGDQIDRDFRAWQGLDAETKQSVLDRLEKDLRRSDFDMGDEDTAAEVAQERAVLKRAREGSLMGYDYGFLMGILRALED